MILHQDDTSRVAVTLGWRWRFKPVIQPCGGWHYAWIYLGPILIAAAQRDERDKRYAVEDFERVFEGIRARLNRDPGLELCTEPVQEFVERIRQSMTRDGGVTLAMRGGSLDDRVRCAGSAKWGVIAGSVLERLRAERRALPMAAEERMRRGLNLLPRQRHADPMIRPRAGTEARQW